MGWFKTWTEVRRVYLEWIGGGHPQQSTQETLYLTSIKGMRESIIEGLSTSVEECSEEFDW